ncbi:hypothetical protein ACKWTF_009317 [Chironomus riparius]
MVGLKLFVFSLLMWLELALSDVVYPHHREHFINPLSHFPIDPQQFMSSKPIFDHFQHTLLNNQNHENDQNEMRKSSFINYGNANMQQGITQYGYGNMNLQGNIQQVYTSAGQAFRDEDLEE